VKLNVNNVQSKIENKEQKKPAAVLRARDKQAETVGPAGNDFAA
jgi:hypothetical protein